MRRMLAGLLILVLVLGLLPLHVLAAQYSDIEGHWAEGQIGIWLEKTWQAGILTVPFAPISR